jgi:chloramphenicol-sensitive protein RarD
VGSVALLGAFVVVSRGGGEVVRVLREPRRAATFLLTTLLISCNWILYIWSVNSGHVLEASLGYFVNPLVNVLLGVVFLKERLDRRQQLSVGLAAVGVGWLVLSYGRFPWISLTLASTFGLYALVRKRARIDAVAGLLVETALLAPAAGAYLLWLAWRGEAHFGTSTGMSLSLLSAGAITAFPLVWFTLGVHQLRLSTMGILQYLSPTLQFLLAVLLYREPFTRAHAVTFAFIWASLAIYTGDALAKARRREPAPAVDPLD